MKKVLRFLAITMGVLMISCGHSHEHSEIMEEVISMNQKLWEDVNKVKSHINSEIKKSATITQDLDSAAKSDISKRLIHLTEQKALMTALHDEIPELKGYEPKCTHEPGEPHTHSSVDINGIKEDELLEIHKTLKDRLDAVKQAVSYE